MKFTESAQILRAIAKHPRRATDAVRELPLWRRVAEFVRAFPRADSIVSPSLDDNPLRRFFNARTEGRGIWKFDHYFDVYHRHFAKFRGTDVHVLEVGVFSGGSLDMWKDYFGPKAHIYGVDIQPACRAYEDAQTTILIGDQGSREFWSDVRRQVPRIDVVVDDGSHVPEHQTATLEELLPHLSPGGVYLCEDVTGEDNAFATYAHLLAQQLNALEGMGTEHDNGSEHLRVQPTALQSAVTSVHHYPYVTVIERSAKPVTLVAPKHGTEWQPFLK